MLRHVHRDEVQGGLLVKITIEFTPAVLAVVKAAVRARMYLEPTPSGLSEDEAEALEDAMHAMRGISDEATSE